ncbi:MAG: efflux transporter outer membrane subunit [Heliobacteriaceae bacterium]|jgi:NodT family efflux transporter outer membrane factor (OMF) lipoprotein|nr:efflux transporter outer membrane subunit [Heliobacteriaceae bacterium]
MKKITAIALLIALNITPVFAAESMPKQFKSMAAKSKLSDDYKYAYVNMNWWDNFNDDILNNYIEKAVLNNYDLKMAAISVDEYYQNVRLQFSHELPNANIGLTSAYTKLPAMLGGEKEWQFIAPAMASYEVDLFLKNRDKTKSVKKLYEASKFDERAAYISVASAVGTTYLNIVKLDKIINIQEEIVASRKTIYDLMLMRNIEGITSTADTVRANKAYMAGTSDLLELKKQREKLLNQLAVLIGESPENSSELVRADLDKISYNTKMPEQIPSEVIVQRPDYLRAEKMVEKAGIDVRVARKDFLPTINLNGIALFNSGNFGSLLTTSNALAALAGGLTLPLFTGGARIANLKLKKDQYERILQDYYKTNITAIQEVNDAMSAIRLDEEKMSLTVKQANLEARDYKFNESRYNQGVISKLDLIQQKENLLVMNKLLANQKTECLVDYIGLYKATGTKL